MASPFFSGRIPQELMDRIEANMEMTGKSKTEILVSALSLYLGSPQSKEKSENDIEKLWSAIAKLQHDVAALKEKVA